jgi:hypothetical protein
MRIIRRMYPPDSKNTVGDVLCFEYYPVTKLMPQKRYFTSLPALAIVCHIKHNHQIDKTVLIIGRLGSGLRAFRSPLPKPPWRTFRL